MDIVFYISSLLTSVVVVGTLGIGFLLIGAVTGLALLATTMLWAQLAIQAFRKIEDENEKYPKELNIRDELKAA